MKPTTSIFQDEIKFYCDQLEAMGVEIISKAIAESESIKIAQIYTVCILPAAIKEISLDFNIGGHV